MLALRLAESRHSPRAELTIAFRVARTVIDGVSSSVRSEQNLEFTWNRAMAR